MNLHEEFKFYETMWNEPKTSVLKEGWYGADSEVEFETSIYPDIAKYFGLKADDTITYAYYYTDEVIVNYDDAYGRSHEIEEHVPLAQVEEWFKAGYTILDEAKKHLTEARSIADIEAEIAKLQLELAQAKKEEKRAASKGIKSVWVFDIYKDPSDKGHGVSDMVFETETAAINAGWNHLNELYNEGELDYDEDDYTVEAIEIPLNRVSETTLSFSDLEYLWDPIAGANRHVGLCRNCHNELAYDTAELKTGFHCPYCGTFLHK